MIRQQMNARAASEVQGDEHMITDEKAMKYVRKLNKFCGERSCSKCIFQYIDTHTACPIAVLTSNFEVCIGKIK